MFTKIERVLSGMKFAVALLVILSVFMIIATVVESLGGARVASVLIYRSPVFLILEGLLFLSVALTILRRMPFRQRFTGFYLLHLGILAILAGSFVTYHSGVDGHLRLTPQGTNNQVELSRKFFYLQDGTGKLDKMLLPEGFLPNSINKIIRGVKLEKYLPFSSLDLAWLKAEANSVDLVLSGGERLILTTSTKNGQFGPFGRLGGKQYLLVSTKFRQCLENAADNGIVLLDYKNKTCTSVKDTKKSKLGNPFFNWGEYKFFPSMTPYPMNKEHSFVPNVWLLAVSIETIQQKSIVLVGEREKDQLEEKVIAHYLPGKIPGLSPVFSFPYKDDKGNEVSKSFVVFSFEGQQYFLSSGDSIDLNSKEGKKYQAFIAPEFFKLNFQITLDRFQMETNPGTEMPASFESFVLLKDNGDVTKHHVFMNNPLKYQQFTFYQSSYFETKSGFGSILSVNYDPGRMLKYIGSLLLVLGAFLNYYITSKRDRK